MSKYEHYPHLDKFVLNDEEMEDLLAVSNILGYLEGRGVICIDTNDLLGIVNEVIDAWERKTEFEQSHIRNKVEFFAGYIKARWWALRDKEK